MLDWIHDFNWNTGLYGRCMQRPYRRVNHGLVLELVEGTTVVDKGVHISGQNHEGMMKDILLEWLWKMVNMLILQSVGVGSMLVFLRILWIKWKRKRG
ncbi:hypothetical protein [Persicobacter psychrovividus]|uniref:hypothetical protein n=1 Tax=Persicobacter psychrovividus TaxID=387638 RepID=UPI0030CA3958